MPPRRRPPVHRRAPLRLLPHVRHRPLCPSSGTGRRSRSRHRGPAEAPSSSKPPVSPTGRPIPPPPGPPRSSSGRPIPPPPGRRAAGGPKARSRCGGEKASARRRHALGCRRRRTSRWRRRLRWAARWRWRFQRKARRTACRAAAVRRAGEGRHNGALVGAAGISKSSNRRSSRPTRRRTLPFPTAR